MRMHRLANAFAALATLTSHAVAQQLPALPVYTPEQRWLRAANLNLSNGLTEYARMKALGLSPAQFAQLLFKSYGRGWTPATPWAMFGIVYGNLTYPGSRCDLQAVSDSLVRAECNRPYAVAAHSMATYGVTLAEYEAVNRGFLQLVAQSRGFGYSEELRGDNMLISIRRGIDRSAAMAANGPAAPDTAAARAALRIALGHQQALGGTARIRSAANKAVELAPTWGLARALQVTTSGATAAQVEESLGSILGNLGSAPAAEVLLITYWKEASAGRAAAALPLIRAAAELMPNEAGFVWPFVQAQWASQTIPEQIRSVRDFQRRFPDYAAGHLQISYMLANTDPAGALHEAQEYARLAPDYVNVHDTYVDILLLSHRPADALPHAQEELRADSNSAGGLIKLGAISLQQGNAEAARTQFTIAFDRFTAPVFRAEMQHWIAASYVYAGDRAGAMTAFGKMLGVGLTPAQASAVHLRMGALEAYLGDRNAVASHLTAAGSVDQSATSSGIKAIVLARSGDLDGARKAITEYQGRVPATNTFGHTLNALVALQAKDLKAAAAELAKAPEFDSFTRAVKADLLARQGQKRQSDTIRQDLSTGPIHNLNNSYVDFYKVLAKLHVDRM